MIRNSREWNFATTGACIAMGLALLLGGKDADAGADPAVTCAVAKATAAAQRFTGTIKCYSAAAKKGTAVDSACLTKVQDKFTDAFAKAEAKGGCVAGSGSAASVAAIVDAAVASIEGSLPSEDPLRCDIGATGPDTCAACVSCATDTDGPCEAAWQTCLDNPECVALNSCFNSCADEACLQACYISHGGGGGTDYGNALTCALGSCPVTCQ